MTVIILLGFESYENTRKEVQGKDNASKEKVRKTHCKGLTLKGKTIQITKRHNANNSFFVLPCIFLPCNVFYLQCPFLAFFFFAISFLAKLQVAMSYPCILLPHLVLSFHCSLIAMSFPRMVLFLHSPFPVFYVPCILLIITYSRKVHKLSKVKFDVQIM